MAISSLVHRDPFFPFYRALGARPVRPARSEATFRPSIDVVEREGEYRITAELPGLEESDFQVEIEDGVLTLEGEKRSERDADESGGGLHRVERRWGRFARRLRFGSEVDEDGVRASYRHGVLEVVVPKVVEDRAVRTIPVTSA